jgi:rRNA maturation endonuclease Nob1
MVEEYKLLCKQCRNVFNFLVRPGSSLGREVCCPKCGSPDVEEAPAWAPLGSGLNIFEGSEWEYQCQQCQEKFKMPIPQSPTEERERRCPSCGAGHIHPLTATGGEPLCCG